MHRKLLGAALLAAALGSGAAASAQAQERCFGVARAGLADGVGQEARPGSGQVDYQGDAWVVVAAGSCLTMAPPAQPDGTPRRGSLEPLGRDLP